MKLKITRWNTSEIKKNMTAFDKNMMNENNMDGYEKIEQYNEEKVNVISEHYAKIIEHLGENIHREGLEKTPERVAKAMQFLTHGYDLNPEEILRTAMFKEDHNHMVIVKDIEIYSMCEHHMLPFFGKAHIAYIPNGYIVGLSKIPRVVDAFARRFSSLVSITSIVFPNIFLSNGN